MYRTPVYSLWRHFATIRSFSNAASQEQVLLPAVRALVDRYNLDVSNIEATGPGGRLLKGDVLNYVKHQGSRATAATPTTIVKWRTPPTVGEMWSHPPEQLVPRGFAVTNIEVSENLSEEQFEGMVVKATAMTLKEMMSHSAVKILVVMATGGSVTTSVISSDLVTTETPLNKISTLIAQHQQQWNNATHQSISPSICVCTKPGHLSFIHLATLVVPTSPLLLLAQLHDHMISVAVSHDLRVTDQSEVEEWIQTLQNTIHKL